LQDISSEARAQSPPLFFVLRAAAALESLRPHQWLKNLLVFVPLAAAHRLADPTLLGLGVRTFIAFSLCASAIYLLNDLHDLEADRAHPHKCLRPIPSGRLPKSLAIALVCVLLTASWIMAAAIGPDILAVLVVYPVLMVAYTLRLKAIILLDAFVLATGYALRVFAGALAVDLAPSARLLAFCIFLFFSLALLKRYAELGLMKLRDGPAAHARGYQVQDQEFVLTLGISCGALSVLVLALYLGTVDLDRSHLRSQLTWGTCVLLLYWISYMWLTAHRGRMTDDPLVFAIRNRASVMLLSLMAVTAWLAL
jgi:4-hydroxybenzoate polyprenyltransferase